MTRRYLISTIENGEAWHKSAKEHYFVKNNVPTRIIPNYKDRITGIIEDTLVGLSVTGTIHTDRLCEPVFHPNYPETNLVYYEYDDADVANDKSFSYTTTQTWRNANTGGAILDKSESEAEDLEFTFDRGE